MKKIMYLLIFICMVALVGCNKSDNLKTTSSFKGKEVVYSSENSSKIKQLLKSYGISQQLTVEKMSKKNILIIKDEKIVANEKLWNDFYTNTKNKKECSITILQYTAQDDPILTYLSYKDNKFYMMEDDSRDQYRESEKEKDYYEYTFNYLKLFEEDEKIYVYLLNDDNITLEKLNYSLLSSNMNEWIPYGFVFYYDK